MRVAVVTRLVEAGSGRMSVAVVVMMTVLLNVLLQAEAFCGRQHSSSKHPSTLLHNSKSDSNLSFLSFDLDDTFWPTTKVVNQANAKMIATLRQYGCHDAAIDQFLDTTRSIRKTLDGPTTYTNLRKLSIRTTFERSVAFERNKNANLQLDDIVEECYRAWELERHLAAEEYLFEDALDPMQQLRELYLDTAFAAITNGAGDPLQMQRTLAPFFDFRVSGEEEGVFPYRKPAAQIYEAALQRNRKRNGGKDHGVWCHVGDCLANDVAASAACGAKAIWMCPEDHEIDAVPHYSTATADEIARRARQVVEGRSKVAASITSLSQLPEAIATILQEAKVAA